VITSTVFFSASSGSKAAAPIPAVSSPPPNPFQQALGLGLAGLGAYRAFQGV